MAQLDKSSASDAFSSLNLGQIILIPVFNYEIIYLWYKTSELLLEKGKSNWSLRFSK